MNRLLPRSIKSAYRRERLSSLLILAGIVDVLIGGFGEEATLIAFGLLVVLSSGAWRWLQNPSIPMKLNQSPQPRRYLPPASSLTPLPPLTHQKSHR